jgi:Zn-dependent protease
MRDPMTWSLRVFRAFGIPVKVHVLFPVVALGLLLRQITLPGNVVSAGDAFLFAVVMLFAWVLMHELGHCFGGRAVGGEPREILLWPLGGLATVDAPPNWRAHTLVAAAGPAVNALICIVCSVPLFAGGFLPNANPVANPYDMSLKKYSGDGAGRVYTSHYDVVAYQPGTTIPAEFTPEQAKAINDAHAKKDFDGVAEKVKAAGFERELAPTWAVWAGRGFWLSWVMLLLNFVPGYPLDGGQILQGLVWAKSGYRQGVTVAAYGGFVVSLLFLVGWVSANETLFLGLAVFVLLVSASKLNALDADDGGFGYDFSAGYTSLERDDEPAPRRVKKPQGFFKRWVQDRAARRIRQEVEERQREEERFDLLLDKIHKSGKASLTDEERRFLERVSARYRNRS